jgi:hypothetical protein
MKKLVCLFSLLCLIGLAKAAEQFGRVEALHGSAEIIDANGVPRALAVGQDLHEGDTVATAADSELHIVTVDGGFLALRPNSRFRVDAYLAEKSDEDKVHISLLKGALRSVTGWIGKFRKEAYRTTTATATIGIRGTDHETTVVEAGGGRDLPGTYEHVFEGATFVRSTRGDLEVRPGQFGFVARDHETPPRLLDAAPEFVRDRILRLESRVQERREVLSRMQEKMSEERVEKLRRAYDDATPEQRRQMKQKVRRAMRRKDD